MLHLLKMFWFVVKELLFDSKEEYDFRSKKFNSNKVSVAVALMLSFFLNLWLLERFYETSTSYLEVRKEQKVKETEIEKLNLTISHYEQLFEENRDRFKPLKTKPKPHDKKALHDKME